MAEMSGPSFQLHQTGLSLNADGGDDLFPSPFPQIAT